MTQGTSEELKKEAEIFIRDHVEPFMKDLLTHYEIWSDKYGPDIATETVSRLFAYMIHGPLAGLKEENAAGLINDISQKAFGMFMKVKRNNTSNDNEMRH